MIIDLHTYCCVPASGGHLFLAMTFHEQILAGVWLIDAVEHQDERGCLTKVYSREEYAERGLDTEWDQHLVTVTKMKGAIRGVHWQAEPFSETKLVRCSKGRIFDVLVDVRKDSATFGKWQGFELSGTGAQALFVPPGIAHGFQVLEEDSEVSYLIAGVYRGDLQRGLRWSDPAVGIEWPMSCGQLSERDAAFPELAPGEQSSASA